MRSPVPIPFPLSSSPGFDTHESGGRLINAFAEPLSDTAISDRVYRRVPGLVQFGTSGQTGFRAGIVVNGIAYTAWNGKLVKHTAAGGSPTLVGNLNGSKRGWFARNNAASPDQVFVDPDGNIATFTSATVTNGYPDADLPAVSSVTSIDGYLVFGCGDGRCFATDLNSTAVNALSFGRAEARPDGLIRALTHGSQLVLMGSETLEIWTDQGLSPFPFARSTVIPRGLAGPYAVAGYEDGFSKELIWAAEDNTVVQLNGYTPEKISPPDLDRAIEAVADKSTLDASAYMAGGHAFWELSCPAWTWVRDLNTGMWHERRRYLGNRSRIVGAFPAFGKWLAGDTQSGTLAQITSAAHADLGSPLPATIESGPVANFPHRTRMARADFNFSVGVGVAAGLDPIETDPSVELSWSIDGGRTWSAPRVRKLGRQAKGNQRITINNLGQAGPYGPRFRVTVSDPVYVGFLGATLSDDPRKF